MAHVERRKPQTAGGAVRYRVRYRDPAGKERSKSFAKAVDARRFASTIETDVLRGTYLDPEAGRMTVKQYADEWVKSRTVDPSTRTQTELRLRLHVYPTLGDVPLGALRPSQVQAWLRGLQQQLAPRTVRVIFANLSQVLSAAVDDDRIAKNPCRAGSVRLPKPDDTRLRPWTFAEVEAVRQALPDRYRPLVTLCAGLGLRQGEAFALAVEDIDFLRGVVHVRRQVKLLGAQQVYALPKGRKVRDVPLPKSIGLALAAHLQVHPPVKVALPWEDVGGKPVEARLIVSTRERTASQRNYVNAKVWKPAVVKAVTALREAKVETPLEPTRENGMHALRHFYASMLLDAGESVRALADYLGHADPGFTLRVYTHLMPSSEDRTKKAVDRVFGSTESAADGLPAAYGEGLSV